VERLGDSDVFGEFLLEILERHGWDVYRRRGFAGDGVVLMAQREFVELRQAGATVPGAAVPLFLEAVKYFRVEEEGVAA
jgi:hypothetical protein